MSNSERSISSSQSGQVLLIVVLIMVVALTVGLSLVSRTIINVKTSTDTNSSQKAFSAAEAGVEQALQKGSSLTQNLNFIKNQSIDSSNTMINASVTDVGGTNNLIKQLNLNNNDSIHQDEGIDLYLSDTGFASLYPTGTVTVYWGTPGVAQCSDAAIAIITITGAASGGKVTSAQAVHDAFDPCTSRPSGANNFTSVSASVTTIGTTTYQYHAAISIPSNSGLLMHITPLYADTKIGVIGTSNFPLQGQVITSTGSSGGTQRKISLYQSNGQIPPEMFYTLFVPQ